MAGIGHNKTYVSIESLGAEDKKKIKDAVLEMNDSMTRVAAERDLQKEIVTKMADETGLDKKMFKRMVSVYFKANYNEYLEEQKKFEDFYDGIMK